MLDRTLCWWMWGPHFNLRGINTSSYAPTPGLFPSSLLQCGAPDGLHPVNLQGRSLTGKAQSEAGKIVAQTQDYHHTVTFTLTWGHVRAYLNQDEFGNWWQFSFIFKALWVFWGLCFQKPKREKNICFNLSSLNKGRNCCVTVENHRDSQPSVR